jgi:uncharacterized protein (DUF697 family)
MAAITQVKNFWDILTEIDVRPLIREASQGVSIALVGASGSGRATLADQMRRDPNRSDMETDSPVLILDLEHAEAALNAHLIVLMLDGENTDFSRQRDLARSWAGSGKRVLVFVNLLASPASPQALLPHLPWKARFVVYGPVTDAVFLQQNFVPMVIQILPDRLLALSRDFPLFRMPIARFLVSDTSLSNAAYSFATGLAEIVPILNIPFVVTDMFILTKNQAFLVYKLGLAFGFSTHWQDYWKEFGGILGFGFLWRQLARTLIGLIPGFGIIPKVGIAYAGTVVVGNAVMYWYLNEKHVTRNQINQVYTRALAQSRELIHRFTPKLPRLRGTPKPKLPRPRKSKQKCDRCGRVSAPDAGFCQYCGQPFLPLISAAAKSADQSQELAVMDKRAEP